MTDKKNKVSIPRSLFISIILIFVTSLLLIVQKNLFRNSRLNDFQTKIYRHFDTPARSFDKNSLWLQELIDVEPKIENEHRESNFKYNYAPQNHKKVIPFYVYNTPETNWIQTCNKTLQQRVILRKPDNHLDFHADDIVFASKIFSHPWRVFDIEEAEIFIVPALLGWYCMEQRRHQADDVICENNNDDLTGPISLPKLVNKTADFLNWDRKAVYFRKQNKYKTHLMVAGHWTMTGHFDLCFRDNPDMALILKKMTVGHFESLYSINYNTGYNYRKIEKPNWRCTIIVPYVDWPFASFTQLESKILTFENWKTRPIDLFFVGRIYRDYGYSEQAYQIRRYFSQNLNRTENSNSNLTYIFAENDKHYKIPSCNYTDCTQKLKCSDCYFDDKLQKEYKNLGIKSKYALIIHGDTSSTSRLYDAITNGQIPIIISNTIFSEGLPFVFQVPWLDVVFFVPNNLQENILNNKNDTEKQIFTHETIFDMTTNLLINLPEYLLEQKFRKLLEIRDQVSWLHPNSKVINNILNDAYFNCRL